MLPPLPGSLMLLFLSPVTRPLGRARRVPYQELRPASLWLRPRAGLSPAHPPPGDHPAGGTPPSHCSGPGLPCCPLLA